MEPSSNDGSLPWAAFNRTDRDRRPGTPLPPEATGDPAPDRLERAEALRLMIAAKDARHRIEGSVDREPLYKDPRNNGKGKDHASKTPDIEKPRSYYVDIPEDAVRYEARRGAETLRFATVSDAARCLTGERNPKWCKAIQNAAGGITKGAFGWTWYRVGPRRGARRKAIR